MHPPDCSPSLFNMIEMQPNVVVARPKAKEAVQSSSTVQPTLIRSAAWTKRRHWVCFKQSLLFATPLLLMDLLVAAGSISLTAACVSMLGLSVSSVNVGWLVLTLLVLMSVTFVGTGLYRNVGMHPVEELERVVTATSLALLGMTWVFVWRNDQQVLGEVVSVLVGGLFCLLALPSIRHLFRCRLGRTQWWRRPLVIVSRSDRADELLKEIEKDHHLGWKPVGVVQDFHESWENDRLSKHCLGVEEELPQIVERHSVFWGMLDTKGLEQEEVQAFMDRNHRALPHIVSVSGCRGDSTLFARGISCGASPGVHYQSIMSLFIPRLIKRAIDLTAAVIVLLLLSPVFLILAVAVRLSGPGPIFYSQDRIGLNGRTFRIWKFRSMVQDADRVLQRCLNNDAKLRDEWRSTQKLSRDPRITSIGWLLRKTSLDELPQLLNVLNGTMSLVGPRPIVRSEIEKYGEAFWLYARATPGITGLWQVSGRNLTTYDERLKYDSFYVRNWSVWLDWYILLRTFRVVILCEGAY